jgi:DNA-binding transcriptional MerR regulator
MRVNQVTGQLTVGQLAARTGVRTDTVRYYEREELLPVPQRTDGEHRRYGPADVDRLLFIRGAQRLGLRLAEIRELLGMLAATPGPDCPDPLPGTWCPPGLASREGR